MNKRFKPDVGHILFAITFIGLVLTIIPSIVRVEPRKGYYRNMKYEYEDGLKIFGSRAGWKTDKYYVIWIHSDEPGKAISTNCPIKAQYGTNFVALAELRDNIFSDFNYLKYEGKFPDQVPVEFFYLGQYTNQPRLAIRGHILDREEGDSLKQVLKYLGKPIAYSESVDEQRGTSSSRNPCANNLRLIDAAKENWAMANSKITGDMVEWKDIIPHLGKNASTVVCFEGGPYLINAIGTKPQCQYPLHWVLY